MPPCAPAALSWQASSPSVSWLPPAATTRPSRTPPTHRRRSRPPPRTPPLPPIRHRTPPMHPHSRRHFTVRPGVEQVGILDATPGDAVTVRRPTDPRLDGHRRRAGGLPRPTLTPGEYTVETAGEVVQTTGTVTVLSPEDHPDASFYAEQELATEGLSYITVRDGTTLSATVWLPGPADGGPTPRSSSTRLRNEQTGRLDLRPVVQRTRLRVRRCQHARDRLLGRVVPVLRDLATDRRATTSSRLVAAQPWVQDNAVAWSASRTPASASCTWRPSSRRACWPSRRCR